jgi:hypothetical protein
VIPRRQRFKIGICQEVNLKTAAKKREEKKTGSMTTKQHVTIQALRQEEIVTPERGVRQDMKVQRQRKRDDSDQGGKRANRIDHSRIVGKSTMRSGPQGERSRQST